MTSHQRKAGVGALYGTLEILILTTLKAQGTLHGLEIARVIHERSQDVVRVEEGALYPALHRLERQGLVEGEWQISEKRRRARFYEITTAGKKTLRTELKNWIEHTEAVGKVLGLREA